MRIFIISWDGKHQDAADITKSLASSHYDISVIYSSSMQEPFNLKASSSVEVVRRENHLFWTDKLMACLELSQNQDMLVIHADCKTDDWAALARRCDAALQNPLVSIWSADVQGTYWDLSKTRLRSLAKGLESVCMVDFLVFGASSRAANRLRQLDLSSSLYGWGLDKASCAKALARNELIVTDRCASVFHAVGGGYNRKAASAEQQSIFDQLTDPEKGKWLAIEKFVKTRANQLQRSVVK